MRVGVCAVKTRLLGVTHSDARFPCWLRAARIVPHMNFGERTASSSEPQTAWPPARCARSSSPPRRISMEPARREVSERIVIYNNYSYFVNALFHLYLT